MKQFLWSVVRVTLYFVIVLLAIKAFSYCLWRWQDAPTQRKYAKLKPIEQRIHLGHNVQPIPSPLSVDYVEKDKDAYVKLSEQAAVTYVVLTRDFGDEMIIAYPDISGRQYKASYVFEISPPKDYLVARVKFDGDEAIVRLEPPAVTLQSQQFNEVIKWWPFFYLFVMIIVISNAVNSWWKKKNTTTSEPAVQ